MPDSITAPITIAENSITAPITLGYSGKNGADRTVKSASFTAANGIGYVSTATLTVTDPTGVEGKGYSVLVSAGTTTIGGTVYATAGTIIERVYQNSAWASYQYKDAAAFAAASHTHVSADITDATNAATPNTIVKRDGDGNISAKQLITDTTIAFNDSTSGEPLVLGIVTLTAEQTVTFPDKSGTVALTSDIPTALPASDVYSWAKAATKPSYTASEVSAARAIETKTTDFTAVVGGRYIVESAGKISITDPTGTTAGESYEVWIGSGTIWFNGAGTVYSASRFSIRRRYTGSAWVTPSPVVTDALQVGAANTWNGTTMTGDQTPSGKWTFGDQVQLAATQAATDANSAMTRGLSDLRFPDRLYSAITGGQTAANNAFFQGTYTSQLIPRIALDYNPSKIRIIGAVQFTGTPVAATTSNFEMVVYVEDWSQSPLTASAMTIPCVSVTKATGVETYVLAFELSRASFIALVANSISSFGMVQFQHISVLKNKTGGSLTLSSATGSDAGFTATFYQ